MSRLRVYCMDFNNSLAFKSILDQARVLYTERQNVSMWRPGSIGTHKDPGITQLATCNLLVPLAEYKSRFPSHKDFGYCLQCIVLPCSFRHKKCTKMWDRMIYNRLCPKFEPVPLKTNVYSQASRLQCTLHVVRHYYYYHHNLYQHHHHHHHVLYAGYIYLYSWDKLCP